MIFAGIIALSSNTAAFAEKDNITPQNKPGTNGQIKINPEQRSSVIKNAIDGLVKDGTITKAQAEAVITAMKARFEKHLSGENNDGPKDKGFTPNGQNPCKDGNCSPHGRKHGVLKDLVKDGTITQEQADAIRKAIKSAHELYDKTK